MKKLLTLLGSVGLIASTSAAVVVCSDKLNIKIKIKFTNEWI
ncbi:lipoprotein [Mycoplasma capricolum]